MERIHGARCGEGMDPPGTCQNTLPAKLPRRPALETERWRALESELAGPGGRGRLPRYTLPRKARYRGTYFLFRASLTQAQAGQTRGVEGRPDLAWAALSIVKSKPATTEKVRASMQLPHSGNATEQGSCSSCFCLRSQCLCFCWRLCTPP